MGPGEGPPGANHPCHPSSRPDPSHSIQCLHETRMTGSKQIKCQRINEDPPFDNDRRLAPPYKRPAPHPPHCPSFWSGCLQVKVSFFNLPVGVHIYSLPIRSSSPCLRSSRKFNANDDSNTVLVNEGIGEWVLKVISACTLIQ